MQLILNFMKNHVLKISGVSFSKCLYFWPACWGSGGFPVNFKHSNAHMQKESPRGSRNDHFGYRTKLNIEITKMMKMINLQIITLRLYLRLGCLRDHQKAFPGLENDS